MKQFLTGCLSIILPTWLSGQSFTLNSYSKLPTIYQLKQYEPAQNLLPDTVAPCFLDQFKKRKYAPVVIGTSAAVIGTSTYFLMKSLWWGDKPTKFHFDWNRDYKYANNVDKLGHFMGGVWASDFYNSIFKTLTFNENESAWYAFGMAAGIQMAIEVKDGLAPNWGFSLGDVTAGSLGGLLYVGRRHSEFLRQTDFKMSYWQYSTKYFDDRGWAHKAFDPDDYLNQTYWVSTSLRYLTREKIDWVPDWLNLAVGFGLEAETWNRNGLGEGGRWEFYVAPDINLEKLFKPKKKFWKAVVHTINYVKVPMPTLQIGPKVKAYGLYF
ncbi:MAG: hypothetical protein RLZZ628_204 [Bacteroidota bacterium]|jgi:hypothetical protein